MLPKKISHIWIGPFAPPLHWMQTWKDKHPDWQYSIYDNAYLGSRTWRLQKHIDEYMRRGTYSGVADMMRYEILLEQGGFIAPADSICLHPVDDLFVQDKAYTVFENEMIRGNLMMPFLSSPPENKAIRCMIEIIEQRDPLKLGHAYLSTGNYIVGKVARRYPDDVIILPSYTFYPNHVQGIKYTGSGKIYAEQFSGTFARIYNRPKANILNRIKWKIEDKRRKRYFWKMVKNAEYIEFNDEDLSLLNNNPR